MVNVFLVHSRHDSEEVERIRKYLEGTADESGNSVEESECHCNVLVLKGTQKSWKREAAKLIKQAQVVLFIQGQDAASKLDTIGWEIKEAIKRNKTILLHRLDPDFETPDYLKIIDPFTKYERPVCHNMTKAEIKKRIDDFDKGEYNIFSPDFLRKLENNEEIDISIIMDQYKMYQQTSEELVSRRQSVNQFYETINGAIIALCGTLAGVIKSDTILLLVTALSFVGIILNISWLNILSAYGTLNASKMKVINLIERKLPIMLYDVEWKIMSDKMNSKKYVSFTDSERRIPKIFIGIFILSIIITLTFYIVNIRC